MGEPILVVTIDGTRFPLAHVKAQEVIKVKSWTGYKNRKEWFQAILAEDVEALLAAMVIAKHRSGDLTVRFSDADFDTDEVSATFENDEGVEVEPVLELNDDGTVKTDPHGKAIPVLDEGGHQVWRAVGSGEVIPFTIPA